MRANPFYTAGFAYWIYGEYDRTQKLIEQEEKLAREAETAA